MEKSTAARNEKVSNNIPDDLAFFIMSKLPLKSLKRFVSVHKSWALLFETPHFMSMFRNNFLSDNHSYYNDTSLLLHQTTISSFDDDHKFVLYSLSGERFENRAKLDWPNPFQEDEPVFDISGSGSVNGILCLISYSQSNIQNVLWNPATREFRVIPTSPLEFVPYIEVEVDRHGFGYDRVRDDYKVIRRVTYFPESDSDNDSDSDSDSVIDVLPLEDISYDLFWEIYSLRSNSWRKITADIPNYEDQGVYTDGVCHWWGESDETDEAFLVSFDLSNEVFITTPIPSNEDDSLGFGWVQRHLVVLSRSIALISTDAKMPTFHISILGELGVQESWIKLFTVGPLSCIDQPIGAGKKGDIFFRKEDGELACFDLCTQMIEELGVILKGFCCQIVIHKESLLPIGGIHN